MIIISSLLIFRVYKLERQLKTPDKFLHPCFETVNWYAAVYLLDRLKGEKTVNLHRHDHDHRNPLTPSYPALHSAETRTGESSFIAVFLTGFVACPLFTLRSLTYNSTILHQSSTLIMSSGSLQSLCPIHCHLCLFKINRTSVLLLMLFSDWLCYSLSILL